MVDIIQPFNGSASDPDSPLGKAVIGGFPIEYFKEPGVGVSPPPRESYRAANGTGEVDYPKFAGETLKWTADKTVAQGIILSAIVRELIAGRAVRKTLSENLAAANSELSTLRLELAKGAGDLG